MSPASPWVRRFEKVLAPGVFRPLLRGVRGLEHERLRSTYQTTFWFDFDEPRCIPELAAMELRKVIPPGKTVVGCEWWLSRMRTTDVRVDFHTDRDERLALRTGKIVHPRWSSVLFLNRCRGGLLAVTEQPPSEGNPSLAPEVLDLELVRPSPNRFVVFDGALTHGVLDARNRIPEGKLPGSPPLRLAVIFNWWHRRPEGVPRWSETKIYRSLALAEGKDRAARAASRSGDRSHRSRGSVSPPRG